MKNVGENWNFKYYAPVAELPFWGVHLPLGTLGMCPGPPEISTFRGAQANFERPRKKTQNCFDSF